MWHCGSNVEVCRKVHPQTADEGGKEAWNFLVGRRRDYPSTGDPQAYAILDAAFPGWRITRKRKTVLASVTGENE